MRGPLHGFAVLGTVSTNRGFRLRLRASAFYNFSIEQTNRSVRPPAPACLFAGVPCLIIPGSKCVVCRRNHRQVLQMSPAMAKRVSAKTVGRLSLYRRLLARLQSEGTKNVYSHELATIAGCTAAQLRRDIMAIGYSGNPIHGYDVEQLIESIGRFLDARETIGVALVGVGNLGRAILHYFAGRRPKLAIVAAFDSDPQKAGRVIHDCRCYDVAEMPRIIGEKGIALAIITVPGDQAQRVADILIMAGVRGILNFAPAPLRTPKWVYVEDLDMTTSLEKVAYFAR